MEPGKLDDRKYTRPFALLALFLFLTGGWIGTMAVEKEEQAALLAEENRSVRTFELLPERESALPFLTGLFQKENGESMVSLLEEAGLQVERIEEEEIPGEKGDFHKFRVFGSGSFRQILQTFDIIKGKENWNAVELKDLKRSPQGLAFEIEVRTFQIRGTYEKEKYSSHRSYGHREEPGSEDPL